MSNPKDLNRASPWNMRIWDEAKHQWLCDGEDDVLPYYGFAIRGGEVTAFQGIDWIYKQHKRWNDFIWERSTGLTDKNGKEIYEGDIVQDSKGVEKCRVEWNTREAHFGLYVGKQMELTDFIWMRGEDLEVIGNIHDNPELLGGEE